MKKEIDFIYLIRLKNSNCILNIKKELWYYNQNGISDIRLEYFRKLCEYKTTVNYKYGKNPEYSNYVNDIKKLIPEYRKIATDSDAVAEFLLASIFSDILEDSHTKNKGKYRQMSDEHYVLSAKRGFLPAVDRMLLFKKWNMADIGESLDSEKYINMCQDMFSAVVDHEKWESGLNKISRKDSHEYDKRIDDINERMLDVETLPRILYDTYMQQGANDQLKLLKVTRERIQKVEDSFNSKINAKYVPDRHDDMVYGYCNAIFENSVSHMIQFTNLLNEYINPSNYDVSTKNMSDISEIYTDTLAYSCYRIKKYELETNILQTRNSAENCMLDSFLKKKGLNYRYWENISNSIKSIMPKITLYLKRKCVLANDADYDIKILNTTSVSPRIPYYFLGEQVEYVKNVLAEYSKETCDLFSKYIDDGYVKFNDSCITIGTTYNMTGGRPSRVAIYAQNIFHGGSVLIHEFGHVFHNFCMYNCPDKKSEIKRRTDSSFSESCSQFFELLYYDYCMKNSESMGENIAYILDSYLTKIIMISVNECLNIDVENEIFNRYIDEDQVVSLSELLEIKKRIYKTAYGSEYDADDYDMFRNSRFYEEKFYDLNYLLGLSLSFALFEKYKIDKDNFAKKYNLVLSKSYKHNFSEIAEEMGINFGRRETFDEVFSNTGKMIDEFMELTDPLVDNIAKKRNIRESKERVMTKIKDLSLPPETIETLHNANIYYLEETAEIESAEFEAIVMDNKTISSINKIMKKSGLQFKSPKGLNE